MEPYNNYNYLEFYRTPVLPASLSHSSLTACLLKKVIFGQTVKNLPVVYETRSFITLTKESALVPILIRKNPALILEDNELISLLTSLSSMSNTYKLFLSFEKFCKHFCYLSFLLHPSCISFSFIYSA
jgi:hypothetical protein